MTDLSISCRSTHNWSSVNLDYCNKYYSGRCSTYKFDRTIVTAGAPRMLAMSTSPPSVGASTCAPAATASSAATTAGTVPSCAPVVTTSSTVAATGSVLPYGAGGWRSNCAKSSSTVGAGLRLPTGSPHCVPYAFVSLLDGPRWRDLLHTRKITHQQAYSYDRYSTTLFKTSYLLRRGL
jgi:hypothetical protein